MPEEDSMADLRGANSSCVKLCHRAYRTKGGLGNKKLVRISMLLVRCFLGMKEASWAGLIAGIAAGFAIWSWSIRFGCVMLILGHDWYDLLRAPVNLSVLRVGLNTGCILRHDNADFTRVTAKNRPVKLIDDMRRWKTNAETAEWTWPFRRIRIKPNDSQCVLIILVRAVAAADFFAGSETQYADYWNLSRHTVPKNGMLMSKLKFRSNAGYIRNGERVDRLRWS